MVTVVPVEIDGKTAIGITVELPKTRLVAITTEKGYIMCGALDVDVLNTRLAQRQVLAGRAFGVRTLQDLLDAPLHDVTEAAERLGVTPGMTGLEALKRFF